MWKWWWGIGIALVIASPTIGLAQGRIPLNAASSFSRRDQEASCSLTVRNDAGSGQGAYVTRDCSGSTPEGFYWLFRWLPGMPLTGTVTVDLETRGNGTGASNYFCVLVYLGCSSVSGSDYTKALTFGNVSAACPATASATEFTKLTISGVALPTTIAADRWCGLSVLRDTDGAGVPADDVMTQDLQIRGGDVAW